MAKLSGWAVIVGLIAMSTPAYAYIDPNSGGLIAQIMTPLLIVIGVAWTGFRHKLVSLVSSVWNALRGNRQNDAKE